jgi:ketosteroid isomerase-like protein
MSDLEEIQQLLNVYTDAAGRNDADTLASTFLEDGEWELTMFETTYKGREAIKAAVLGFAESLDYIVQINAPAVITVDGESATASSAIREGGKVKDKLESLEVLGHYRDQVVRTSDGWKFSRRVFELQGMHRSPLVEGE